MKVLHCLPQNVSKVFLEDFSLFFLVQNIGKTLHEDSLLFSNAGKTLHEDFSCLSADSLFSAEYRQDSVKILFIYGITQEGAISGFFIVYCRILARYCTNILHGSLAEYQ